LRLRSRLHVLLNRRCRHLLVIKLRMGRGKLLDELLLIKGTSRPLGSRHQLLL